MIRLAVTPGAGGKAAAAYEFLKESAMRGQIRPGRQLVPAALAKTFGTSHTPVREALYRLFGEGFVDWRKNQGYYSKVFTELEQRELHEFGLALLTTSMEAFLADRATQLLEDLADLDPALAEGADAAINIAARAEAMYIGLAEATGNSVRVNTTRIVIERTHIVRVIDLRNDEVAVATLEVLRGVGRALLRQDPETAQRLGRDTLTGRLERLAHLVGEANAHAAASLFPA